MLRTSITIAHHRYLLAQGADLTALKTAVVTAVREGGAFVDFTVVGNRQVSVLVAAGTGVVIEATEVPFDTRDDGDLRTPFADFDDPSSDAETRGRTGAAP